MVRFCSPDYVCGLVAGVEKCGTGRQTHTLELRTHSPSSESGCWIATLVSMCFFFLRVCVCGFMKLNLGLFHHYMQGKKALVVFYSYLINTA